MKNYIKKSLAVFSVLILAGCGASFNKIIREEPVKVIPDKKYETIIRLRIWENDPLHPEAGFVYVVPGGKVTTDFPREEVVKDIQRNRNNMSKFVIRDSEGKVRGYYELVPEYTAIIWERGDDILLQIIIPNSMDGSSDRIGDDRRSGGGHGGHGGR